MLKNKNILIGITGSIAIYKIAELIRLFVKQNANVRVIMTSSAKRFIVPLTFESLSRNKVLDDDSESWANDLNHIDIGKWADVMIIAPATANTINKLSNGIADNLLTQTALAYNGVKILAPSANTVMIENPITQASLKMLNLNDYIIVSPVSKLLACGDEGNGAMAEVNDLYHISVRELLKVTYWEDRRVVLSGGGTIEKIDDVRYISNNSSGKMATELARALYFKGADVCLVSSKILDLPNTIHIIEATSSIEYKEFLEDCIRSAKKGIFKKGNLSSSDSQLIQKEPYLFMVAAISDYVPKYPQQGKLKKDSLGDTWNLELIKNIDILKSINKDGIKTVGFKAEMDKNNAEKNSLNMLKEKLLDAVVLNIIDSSNEFGSDNNEVIIFDKNNKVHIPTNTKLNISNKILTHLEKIDD